MKIKSQRDFWSGLLFLAVGAAFAVGATAYDFGSLARPGAGYFPFGLGLLLALVGVLVLLQALSIESGDGEPIGTLAWRPLGVLVAAIVLFGLALPRLGLLLTLPMLVTLSALAGNEFRWRDALLNSVLLTLGCWLVFVQGLKLMLPLWPAGLGG